MMDESTEKSASEKSAWIAYISSYYFPRNMFGIPKNIPEKITMILINRILNYFWS